MGKSQLTRKVKPKQILFNRGKPFHIKKDKSFNKVNQKSRLFEAEPMEQQQPTHSDQHNGGHKFKLFDEFRVCEDARFGTRKKNIMSNKTI